MADLFQASSAACTFCRAVSSVNGGTMWAILETRLTSGGTQGGGKLAPRYILPKLLRDNMEQKHRVCNSVLWVIDGHQNKMEVLVD